MHEFANFKIVNGFQLENFVHFINVANFPSHRLISTNIGCR